MEPDKKPSKKADAAKKDADRIEQKLDRLQKKNEAASIALKKLLNGLEKIGTPPFKEEKPKRKKK